MLYEVITNIALKARIAELATESLGEAYRITEKASRYNRIAELQQQVSYNFV